MREKIRLACSPDAARWQAADRMSIYASSLEAVRVLPESDMQDVVRMSCEGGSPGLVLHLAHEHKKLRPKMLETVIASWQQGIEDLQHLSYLPRCYPDDAAINGPSSEAGELGNGASNNVAGKGAGAGHHD